MMPALDARASCGQWPAFPPRWTLNERTLPRTASTHCTENAQRICESGEHAATALTKTSKTLPNKGACPHHLPNSLPASHHATNCHHKSTRCPRCRDRFGALVEDTAKIASRSTLASGLQRVAAKVGISSSILRDVAQSSDAMLECASATPFVGKCSAADM